MEKEGYKPSSASVRSIESDLSLFTALYGKVFACAEEGCNKQCGRRDNLQQHLRREHGIDCTSTGRFKCHVDDCEQFYYHRTQLIGRLKTACPWHWNWWGIHILLLDKQWLLCAVESPRSIRVGLPLKPAWKEEEEAQAHCHFSQPMIHESDSGKLNVVSIWSVQPLSVLTFPRLQLYCHVHVLERR